MTKQMLMISLIRAQLCGGTISEEMKNALTEPMRQELFDLSVKHDMVHIVAQALDKHALLGDDEIAKQFRKATKIALYRYFQQNNAYVNICKTFEQAQIPFIPLKGAVLRSLYPEPWLRTSADIDILVKPEDLERTVQVLREQLSCTCGERRKHDLAVYTPDKIYIELHFSVVDDEDRIEKVRQLLENFWEYAQPVSEGAYCYKVSDESRYFYHVAHMAKHIQVGGCGVRPFLDMWMLNHKVDFDKQKRDAFLEKGGLKKFADESKKLSEFWFSDREAEGVSDYYAQYIFEGGKFGATVNRLSVRQMEAGGKKRYVFQRIFQPYDKIKTTYPILEKHKWLTGYYQIVRWCRLIFKSGLRKRMREMKVTVGVSDEQLASVSDLIKELGL